jgi:hypothetical protein
MDIFLVLLYSFLDLLQLFLVILSNVVTHRRAGANYVSVSECGVNTGNRGEYFTSQVDPRSRIGCLLTCVGIVPCIIHKSFERVWSVL